MKEKMTLSKRGLVCYLMNELGEYGAWEVTTYLDDSGAWHGKLDIEWTEKDSEDIKYFQRLIEGRV